MAKIVIQKKIKDFEKIIKVDSDKSLSIRSLLISSQSFGLSKISNLSKFSPDFNPSRIGCIPNTKSVLFSNSTF